MTILNRGRRAADEPAPAEASEPVTDSVPGDLAATAAELRQSAREADEEAIRLRAEAESVVAAANADAERIRREGHAKALPLIAEAAARERKAAELGGSSKHHEHAARQEALTGQHEAQAADLSAEHEHLTEIVAGLDRRLAELGTDRERLEGELAAAQDAAEVDRIAAIRGQLEATGEAVAALAGQREKARVRALQVGNGTETGPGLLTDALSAAARHRTALTEALDELYPDRPGAEHRRDLARLKDALVGNLARMAEEAKAEPTSRRRAGFADIH